MYRHRIDGHRIMHQILNIIKPNQMTIKQLFEQMNAEEIAFFSINVAGFRDALTFFTNEYEDMKDWISCAFVWGETAQGHDYWERIAYRVNENEEIYSDF